MTRPVPRSYHAVNPHGTLVGLLLPIALLALAARPVAAAEPQACASLTVDAREAPQRIVHAHLRLPARPGPLTLYYPKWIPGEHAPTGPIRDLAGLRMTTGGREVRWWRDPVDLYAFHVDVPAGADTTDVELDYLVPTSARGLTGGSSVSQRLAVINWNQLLLYRADLPADSQCYAATLVTPAGWKAASALTVARSGDGSTTFEAVSLRTLVDSPVIAGAHFRAVPIGPREEIDMVADSEEALALPDSWDSGLRRLIQESAALFGGTHYRGYRFLVTLSDHVGHFGLEHHESSDDRMPERALIDRDTGTFWVRLLGHELVHSWNGKYRRPAQQVVANYQEPRSTELLWVYEGLTAYLGDVLTVRSGLWPAAMARDRWGHFAGELAEQPGRSWRSLTDTAVSARALLAAPEEGASWRRTAEFYSEGELLWLQVDLRIRQLSHGRRSLDDFCRRFFGGSGAPVTVPYSREELVAALSAVAPFDWRAFLAARVDAAAAPPPGSDMEGSGWRLGFTDAPNDYTALVDRLRGVVDARFSLGIELDEEGYVNDVIAGSKAARAGIAPGARVVAVDRRRYTPSILQSAVAHAAEVGGTIDLLMTTDDYFDDYRLDASAGSRYPHLDRDPTQLDRLSEILSPRARPITQQRVAGAPFPRTSPPRP